MKLGIMQPYLFPYIGYFQHIAFVDKFIAYDDVAFIKQGWINRNRILLNGRDLMFTVKLKDASSFTLIKDTQINDGLYESWKTKFYKTLEQAYKKAPHFKAVFPLIKGVFESENKSIGKLALNSIKSICSYLEISTQFVDSSAIYNNTYLTAQTRVIDICKQENADKYINLKGGMELYSKKHFAEDSISLHFIGTKSITYPQFNHDFVPWLSVIDVLMFNTVAEIKSMLNQYEIL